MIALKIGDESYQIPVQIVGRAIYSVIPSWLRDSSIDPPEDETQVKAGFNKRMLIGIRASIKGLISPFLPKIYEALYGQKMKIDRSDTLPVIAGIIVNFAVRQLYEHPMEVVLDGEGKNTVVGFRPYQQSTSTLRSD